MKITYKTKSLIKRLIGFAIGAGGLIITWIFVKGILSYLVYSGGAYTYMQMQQVTTFVRVTIIITYLFVTLIWQIFSDNSLDKQLSWMGPKQRKMLKSVLEDESTIA